MLQNSFRVITSLLGISYDFDKGSTDSGVLRGIKFHNIGPLGLILKKLYVCNLCKFIIS
jgi:hypothetical protein